MILCYIYHIIHTHTYIYIRIFIILCIYNYDLAQTLSDTHTHAHMYTCTCICIYICTGSFVYHFRWFVRNTIFGNQEFTGNQQCGNKVPVHQSLSQWIGLRSNLQETSIFLPEHLWNIYPLVSSGKHAKSYGKSPCDIPSGNLT